MDFRLECTDVVDSVLGVVGFFLLVWMELFSTMGGLEFNLADVEEWSV